MGTELISTLCTYIKFADDEDVRQMVKKNDYMVRIQRI